jgi:hypothetical protein
MTGIKLLADGFLNLSANRRPTKLLALFADPVQSGYYT